MKRAIEKNWKWVLTIFGLGVFALLVAGYVLKNQRVRFPWEGKAITMYVESQTAQAVTPGQGQSVQVAGVKIGQIVGATLKEGRAKLELQIEPKNKGLIRTDAKAMLRPRTPLKDMYIQVLPGTKDAPAAKKGHIIPVANVTTDVTFDQVLDALDGRTRDYLQLFVHGAKTGLHKQGPKLAEVFKRYGVTASDLARVNKAVGQEHAALRRTVTSLADLNSEIAKNPEALTQLVDASAATFTAFASEDRNLRASLSELPPTLRQARTTLNDIRPFARNLGPTTRALTPAVRALDDANEQVRPFARKATPIVQKEIRPFVRGARPLVGDLAPAAKDLSATIPELVRSTRVANRFFNMLASNPNGAEGKDAAGREEGYLFWLGWLFHQTVNLQNVEDANGPMRPIFLTGTCSTLTSLANNNPLTEFGLNLSPVLATQCGNPNTLSTNLGQLLQQLPAPLKDAFPIAPPGGAK